MALTRRKFLVTSAAAVAGTATFGIRPSKAASQHFMKFGINLKRDHPTVKHLMSAAKKIKQRTDGNVVIKIFPNNELGDDTHMLSNARSGAIEMIGMGDNILATVVPEAAIDNIGFAFKDVKTAWQAADGKVGDIVRPAIQKAGLRAMHKIWDEGYREVTTSKQPVKSPDDIHGLKMRVPPSPMNLSIFKSLGASPSTIDYKDLYTSLQTGVVTSQENPLGVIESGKLYQVQKYCSLTNHMWNGYWMLVNDRYWQQLPKHYQTIISNTFDEEADKQRKATEHYNSSLQSKLSGQGLNFLDPGTEPFRKRLVKSGYYDHWQKQFGPDLWSALEKYTGTLG